MWFGDMPIHIKIACRLWHFQHNTLHFWANYNLTSQPTGFRQTIGHIQHVFFILGRLWEYVIQCQRQDQVACTASTHSFTGTLQFDFVSMSHLEQCFAHSSSDSLFCIVWLKECNVDRKSICTVAGTTMSTTSVPSTSILECSTLQL